MSDVYTLSGFDHAPIRRHSEVITQRAAVDSLNSLATELAALRAERDEANELRDAAVATMEDAVSLTKEDGDRIAALRAERDGLREIVIEAVQACSGGRVGTCGTFKLYAPQISVTTVDRWARAAEAARKETE